MLVGGALLVAAADVVSGAGELEVTAAGADTVGPLSPVVLLSPRTSPMIAITPTTSATASTLGIATGISPRAGRGRPRCVPGRTGP